MESIELDDGGAGPQELGFAEAEVTEMKEETAASSSKATGKGMPSFLAYKSDDSDKST